MKIGQIKFLAFLFIAFLLLIIFVFLFFKKGVPTDIKDIGRLDKESAALKEIVLQESFYEKTSFLKATGCANETASRNDIDAIVVPHHLLAACYIADLIKKSSGRDIRQVVIIGPNHDNVGIEPIASADAKWQTPFGYAESDQDLTKKFLSDFGLKANPHAFSREHSIGAVIPFVKYYLKDAKILPIIFSSYADIDDVEKVGAWLGDNLSANSLLIISTDFSHYLTKEEAQEKDKATKNLILKNDIEEIIRLTNDNVDSPASLAAGLLYAEKNNLSADFIHHANSFDLSSAKSSVTTSYFGISFFKKPTDSQAVKMLFFGDLMLDRHVKEKIGALGLNYLFEKMGEEFFSGYNLVSANLEGAVTNNGLHYSPVMSYDFAFAPDLIGQLKKYNFNFFNLANNHLTDQGEEGINETKNNLDDMSYNYSGCKDGKAGDCSYKIIEIDNKKIGMLGLSMVYSALDSEEIKNIADSLSSATDFVIANVHWGAEYEHGQNEKQQGVARDLIDSGVDLIIGHHPHVVQGVEIYKNKPIFYSLGNFIFDQYFSKDTQEGLAVSVELNSVKNKIILYPFKSKLSQVELMAEDEKNKFLQDLVGWSQLNPEEMEQIKNGFLLF